MSTVFDYDAPETLLVTKPEQFRAVADPLRAKIIALLRDRARSTQELSHELKIPKGTVGHHMKVLERAGLIKVVRTRRVRAVTEKYYGRTARLFLYEGEQAPDLVAPVAATTLRQAADEVGAGSVGSGFGLVRARLAPADVRRLQRRLTRLIDDFRACDTPDGVPWNFVSGLWRTDGRDA
jgi:DNA-binding transcriptional ArsR family regulator